MPPAELIARAKFSSAMPRKRTWAEKSLIIPCPADKRKLIIACADAGRRKGDFYEKNGYIYTFNYYDCRKR